MGYEIGQIVLSKNGHDRENYFMIVKIENEFLYLADGKIRQIDKPKKKKIKHVQITNYVNSEVKEKLENALKISNADIRDAVDEYKNKNQGGDDLGK